MPAVTMAMAVLRIQATLYNATENSVRREALLMVWPAWGLGRGGQSMRSAGDTFHTNVTLTEADLAACCPRVGAGGQVLRAWCPFHG
jgi:hypothetical protein